MNTEIYHIYYRKIICEFISTKINLDKINYPYILNNNNTVISYMDNFNNIIKTGSFIGQYEIINKCQKLKYNICIYKLENDSNNYNDEFKLIYETVISDIETINPFLPIILIG